MRMVELLKRVAASFSDTLDSSSFHENANLSADKIQRHTVDTSIIKKDGVLSWFDGGDCHWFMCHF